ncbi:hypothetical protein [Delftia sp. JD2]|uniref:hypothetical protein n=1 Tax=Delftia sp. JD2 TaxID=469553 RepID=UPI001111CFED|nr:hypothetical protein [Delftia sp. JD2]
MSDKRLYLDEATGEVSALPVEAGKLRALIELSSETRSFANDSFSTAEHEWLFSKIKSGFRDGLLVYELGIAQFTIRKKLGIESFVAAATHGSLQKYFDWVKMMSGSDLSDWRPVVVTLYECWEPAIDYPSDPEFTPIDRRVWYYKHVSDAASCREVDVFALRHRSWRCLKKGEARKFYCSRFSSLERALWYRDNPGVRPKPTIIGGRSERGFYITGKTKRAAEREILTWPSSDLGVTISRARKLLDRGVKDLVICEFGIGFVFNERMEAIWKIVLELDVEGNQNLTLLGLWDILAGLFPAGAVIKNSNLRIWQR